MSPATPARRAKVPVPNWRFVKQLFAEGFSRVGGLDEVGRGAWAGPVTVGIVVVGPDCVRRAPKGVRDSKLLAEPLREKLYGPLARWCPEYAIGEASAAECDAIGLSAALTLAARRALDQLPSSPEVLVIDGNWDYTGHPAARPVIDADASCFPVAAASVLAKVTRDRQMIEHGRHLPVYGFERNKGYASPEHRRAVARHGMTDLHRQSWSVLFEPDGSSEEIGEVELPVGVPEPGWEPEPPAVVAATSAITVLDGGRPRPIGRGGQRPGNGAAAHRG